MIPRRVGLVVLAAVATISPVVAVGVSSVVAAAPAQVPAPAWGPCEDGVDAEFQCATITAPLDYSNPIGATVPIALIRLPASQPREGAVLFNPGGPGGSGFDFMANAGQVIASEMAGLSSYDLVGFDPRGVDRSGGIRCLDDQQVDATLYLDDTPDDLAEELAYTAADAQFGAACLRTYGDTLIHYSTANTARDMDLIRQSMGDLQISYIGISYGTYLGAVFATMFPAQVRAMVLDSAYEPTNDTIEQQFLTQLVGFEGAFDNFAAWCEEGSQCAFTATDVGARWDTLIARLDSTPVGSADGREVNQTVVETATISALYNELSWPVLGQALADAEAGDGTGLLGLADNYNGRSDEGTFDSSNQSGTVIRCASGIDYDVPPDPAAIAATMHAEAPRFARGVTENSFADSCAALMPNVDPVIPAYSGEAPIVVVGGLNDPATPFRWSEELTALMGPSASLVTFTGEGHGQILSSTCVTDIEAAVISSLQRPPTPTTCDPDPPYAKPAFWDSIPVPPGVGPTVDNPTIQSTIGLPESEYYSQAWVLTGDAPTVLAAYEAALPAIGLRVRGVDTDVIASASTLVTLASDGTALLIAVIPPDAFSSNPDLADLAATVPPGQGLVVAISFDAN